MPSERLQKVLASAGVASRRAAEEIIKAGRVTVNGDVVTRLGSKADVAVNRVRVDGKAIHVPSEASYFLLYKPRGYVSTLEENAQGRPTLRDLMPPGLPRVFHVGRLDTNTGRAACSPTTAPWPSAWPIPASDARRRTWPR